MNEPPVDLTGLSIDERRKLLADLLKRRASIATEAPLSYAQQRLWFLDQLAPGSAFYTMPIALRLRMELDVNAMERTINEIVRRHDVLRTTFQTRQGGPVQVIAPTLQVPLSETDLQHLPVEEREQEAQRLATAEARRPFDLSRGPLIRAALVHLNPRDHVLLLTLHHIISDGWSLGVLFDELSVLYEAFACGRPSPLFELTTQFAQFAIWQRRSLTGPLLDEQLDYWRDQLADLPELVLPTDRPRPSVTTFRGARQFFTISAGLRRAALQLARETETTLFMVLLTVFEVLMSRYSGQVDFPLGIPIANRTSKESEALIGFFVNTLVLRADISGDPTFRESLARIRETTLAAYAHQDLPFERLVEELAPKRDAARNPLIQVMFALQNTPLTSVQDISGSSVEMLTVERGTANFDLVLDLWELSDGIGGRIEYSTDLFETGTIDRLLGHFTTLLGSCLNSPDEAASNLPILTDAERRRILGAWNDTAIPFPADASLPQLYEEQARQHPHAPAVSFGTRSLTYAQVDDHANGVAHALRDIGVVPGDRVAVHMERSPELVVVILGILKTGAAYAPIDTSYPRQRIAATLADARPSVLVTTAELADSLPSTGTPVFILPPDMPAAPETTEILPRGLTGLDPAYLLYTSGSTGVPKGIIVPHRAVIRLVRNTSYIEIRTGDRVAQAASASFDAFTFEMWGALLNGAELVGLPKDVVLSPDGLATTLREQRITTLFLTTAVFNQVAMRNPGAFGSLANLLFGGESADPRWVRRVLAHNPPDRLLHVYGPTECTTFSTWYLVEQVDAEATTVPIGRPLSNTSAFVLDVHGQPVPVGVPGELHIGGSGLALGYLDQPRQTEQCFITSPFGRLYRTGDRVRWLESGALEFLGRSDHQVKLRGHRVELGEIEATLCRHPSVREARVVLREAADGEKTLVAYLVMDDADQSVSGEERVNEWQRVYDEMIYAAVDDHPVARRDPLFNIAGWSSSFTGQPLSPEEMREQVDQTVERILSLAHDDVLEIGCGTGLLLFQVAPRTQRYVATDFSAAALDYVARQLATHPQWPVSLHQLRADELSTLSDQHFDLVVLNSVVQYFPSADYLVRVLRSVCSMLRPGGSIFVGDVRNLLLLETFHAAVALHQAPRRQSIADLLTTVRQRVEAERELVIAPAFFQALAAELPGITRVVVEPKRGKCHNELVAYRYDVTLHSGEAPTPAPIESLDWTRDGLSIQRIRDHLLQVNPERLRIQRVPNARTAHDVAALGLLRDAEVGTVADVLRSLELAPPPGIDPEDLWAISDDVPHGVEITWSSGSPDGAFDVIFHRSSPPPSTPFCEQLLARSSWLGHTNHPQSVQGTQALVPDTRAFLLDHLPPWMIPATFVVLDRFPLTPNGKVDVRALPDPDTGRPVLTASYLAPRTALEDVLAGLWASVLKLERVGINDSFFDIGGHSLLATQLLARVTDVLGVSINLRQLFAEPAVAGFAQALLAESANRDRLERVAAIVLAVGRMPDDQAAALLAQRGDGDASPDPGR